MNVTPLVTAALLSAQLAGAQTLPGVTAAIDPFLARREIAGAITVVMTPEKIVHAGVQGFADIENDVPMRGDAVFWIASMTKPVTAVAILMLQEEGRLSIDDPASKFIPELGQMKNADGSRSKTITLRHLLTHTAGLPENTPEETQASSRLQDLVTAFARKPMAFEPGSQWAYSQTAINSLGRIVEVVSGQRYEDFLAARIFRPLGMNETTFHPSLQLQKRLATPYRAEDGELKRADYFPFTGQKLEDSNRVPLANGGLFSTAADYARFMRMLLNGGTLEGTRILTPESVKQLSTTHTDGLTTGFSPGCAWGLGVCVVREPQGVSGALSPGSYGHGGAYGTQAWIDPVKKIGYLFLVQRANFPNADASDARGAFQDAAAKALAD